MRLLTKSTLALLAVMSFVFLLGGFIFYAQLRSILNEEVNEHLTLKKKEIELAVQYKHKFPLISSSEEQVILEESATKVTEHFTDVPLYSALEKENLIYRQLVFPLAFNGHTYVCKIRQPLFESDDLIETILKSLSIIFGLLLLVFLIINYFFSRHIWKPFFNTLHAIFHYDLEKHPVIQFTASSTSEFKQLHTALEKMTKKLSADFTTLKSFTENAAHELQTPLAIIQNQMEVFMQWEGLSAEQLKQIGTITATASRLSKLNESLLLLSKIENLQFKATESIQVGEIIRSKLAQLEELLHMKQLEVQLSIQDKAFLIHPLAAEIIVSNLISNAIRHSPVKGKIQIELSQSYLCVSNIGDALRNEEKLFDRFYKENPDSTSTGLGLALVKQIALSNRHSVTYSYTGTCHLFKYNFT